MSSKKLWRFFSIALAMAAVAVFMPAMTLAADPVVKTVPWVAANPLIPHDTFPTKSITLKGTCDSQGAGFQYTWDFGDGTPVATGTVTNKYVIEAKHTYTGPVGTVYTARLTVQNTGTGETGSKAYYVAMREKTLPVEVNVAIDEGLWTLHKAQTRYNSGGVDYGNWSSWSGWYGVNAANQNAFFVNGHLEGGNPDNPYVETVQRGMRFLFTCLTTVPISNQSNPLGAFNPDRNGNGVGILDIQGRPYYQGGMFIDAIVASGTPNAVASTGPAGVIGKTYKTIVQDMVDAYLYAQYDYSPGGGWRYTANTWPDNSACQWAAIGLIAAERNWGCDVPQVVKDWNIYWLRYSQHHLNYYWGYTDENPIWGPFATTPSGLVQMAMDGKGRGYVDPIDTTYHRPSWDKAEAYLRNNFDNGGGYSTNIKAYYYGLFSFVKAMLLHVPNPITKLAATATKPDIDWYAAEASKGDTSNGVARTLVNDQHPDGYWWYHDPDGSMYAFETAWAIIMLNRTLFEAGAPVAVAKAIPNPGVAGQIITLDASDSFHQDPTKTIDSWAWDLDNAGTFETNGVVVTKTFPAVGDYVVKLKVTDDGTPEKSAETTVTVRITTPPVAPTAYAGGPYVFCPQAQPWFLDGSGSINPDDGQSEPGMPGDYIKEYAWDLDGDGQFDDAFGPNPDVTAFFDGRPGAYLVQLRVTDNTAASFPSSGYGDLTSTSSAEVIVWGEDDPACECISDLTARPKLKKVQLTWTHTGAASYNVYRGTVSGGPYVLIANTTSTYSTYLDNGPLALGTTYYYVVRPALPNGDELCQSNQASAKPVAR